MSPLHYHFLHIIGLVCVFVGFGALLSSESSKTAMKWHGIGLLISLITGFGMLAKYNKLVPEGTASIYGYGSIWVIAKIVLWLVLGFLPVLARKRVLSSQAVVVLAVVVGAALAYLGIFKPH